MYTKRFLFAGRGKEPENTEADLEALRRWHKIAARADSIKDFEQVVGFAVYASKY